MASSGVHRHVPVHHHRLCGAPRGRATPRNSVTAAASPTSTIAGLPEPSWQDHIVPWTQPKEPVRVQAPPDAPPIVILPGFGNCTTDYTEALGQPQNALALQLQERGFRVYVPEVERKDFFRVARALLTLKYWSASLTTEPGYTWYLDSVAAAVDKALAETGAMQVDLVGHSAGGWLGRAFLGSRAYMDPASGDLADLAPTGSIMASGDSGDDMPGGFVVPHNRKVRSLVTLGTPHFPPEGGRDMTGGAQTWVNRTFPGAFFADRGVRYVNVCGRAVRGHREFPRPRKGPRIEPEYAYDSYKEVCGVGQGEVGDCVVPLRSALLEGAQHVVLDGVFHSMSKIGTFGEPATTPWYGTDAVVDLWLHTLVVGSEARRGTNSSNSNSNGNGSESAAPAATAAGKPANSTVR